MLTNNYWYITKYFSTVGYDDNSYQPGVDIHGTRAMNGEIRQFVKNWSNDSNKNCLPRSSLSIALGTGDTPPTIADYVLTNDVSAYLNLSCTYNTGVENGIIKTVITVSGMNSSTSNFILKEYGIVKEYLCRGGGTSLIDYKYLISHELFDEPKTVNAGESFILNFEWGES